MIVRILPRAVRTVISLSYRVFRNIKQINKNITISTFVTLEMCRAFQTAF